MRLVAQPLNEIQHRIARLELEGLAAWHEQGFAAGVAVRPFCNGQQRDLRQSRFLAEASENLPDRVELAAAAVDDDEIAGFAERQNVGLRVRYPSRLRDSLELFPAYGSIVDRPRWFVGCDRAITLCCSRIRRLWSLSICDVGLVIWGPFCRWWRLGSEYVQQGDAGFG
jgi:hypothetical protein